MNCQHLDTSDLSGNISYKQLSCKEYAAIHLKVPMSGTPWLDKMIEKSLRDDFVKAYISGVFGNDSFLEKAADHSVRKGEEYNSMLAKAGYQTADALVVESKKKKEEV